MDKSICNIEELCTGCTACLNICPQRAVNMVENHEGFVYPVIDETKCINCNLCRKVCPVNNPPKLNGVEEAYVGRYHDLDIVNNSTSGGTYTAFADYTLLRDGIVYGVGYNKKMEVQHFSIDQSEKDRIIEMRGSKYVQSKLDNTFNEIKQLLDAGRLVCFSGTPCQVAGLKSFLCKEYENLVTVDLVCHGVASPKIFKEYIQDREKKYHAKAIDIRFRNKTYGYHSGTMYIKFQNGKQYFASGRIDYMLKAYFAGICSRKSCYVCPFKGADRCSDFTVFDSWNIEKLVKNKIDDDRGYTNIFIHTEKGKRVFKDIKKYLDIWGADPILMSELDGIMISKNPHKDINRDKFFEEIDTCSLKNLMKKYLPISFIDHLLERSKSVAYKLGFFKFLKRK